MSGDRETEARIGSGRFQRKPLATLARLSQMAATQGQEDMRLPAAAEIDDLISYLSMAKGLGELTFGQMDAFWDMNRRLMAAHGELRAFYRNRPALDTGRYPDPPEDTAAAEWFYRLTPVQRLTVIKAAHAQFKDEFTGDSVEVDVSVEEGDIDDMDGDIDFEDDIPGAPNP